MEDVRGSNSTYSLDDVLMSGYAMFCLKYPSLLDFEQQTESERKKLHRLFAVEAICTDAQMRNILDKVHAVSIRHILGSVFAQLNELGLVKEYGYWENHVIVSVDGVEHFRSEKIHCDHCLEKTDRHGPYQL